MNISITPGKAPFHYGLFFCAVRYLIGEPIRKTNLGGEGYYDYWWEVNAKFKKGSIDKSIDPATTVMGWMKCFNLKWPESRCDIAKWEEAPDSDKVYFRITVEHDVPKEP